MDTKIGIVLKYKLLNSIFTILQLFLTLNFYLQIIFSLNLVQLKNHAISLLFYIFAFRQ